MTWPLVSWIFSSDSSSSSPSSSSSFDDHGQDDQEQVQEEIEVCNEEKTQEMCEISGSRDEDDDENGGENGGNLSDIVDLIPTAIAISSNPSSSGVTIAIPSKGVPQSLKCRRTIQWTKSRAGGRKFFPLIWSIEDVLELLRSFLKYTSQPRTNPHYIHRRDSNLFYDEVKSKLQIICNKNQVIEKLKRLRRKYQILSSQINSGSQITFKSTDEQAIFEFSNQIWGSRIRSSHKFTILRRNSPIEAKPETKICRNSPIEAKPETKIYQETATNHRTEKTSPRPRKRPYSRLRDQTLESKDYIKISDLIGPIVRGCVSPILEELLSNAARSWSSKEETRSGEEMADERWKKQKVMEMEVYSKRLELVQDHIRMKMEELKAKER